MTKRKAQKKRANLAGKLANVSIERAGLTIEILSVPAKESGRVAVELMRAMRGLTRTHDELTVDAGTVGAGEGIVVPDEEEMIDDGPPQAKQIGFRPHFRDTAKPLP